MVLHPPPGTPESLRKTVRPQLKRVRGKKLDTKYTSKRRSMRAKKKQTRSAPDSGFEGSKASIVEQHPEEEHGMIENEDEVLDRASQERDSVHSGISRPSSIPQQDLSEEDINNNNRPTYTFVGTSTTHSFLGLGSWPKACQTGPLEIPPQNLSFSSSEGNNNPSTVPDLVSDEETTESEPEPVLIDRSPTYNLLDGIGMGMLNLNREEGEDFDDGVANWTSDSVNS
ncbi:hypothetical protein VTL71DRAFT_3852 [Oculimacula yallundae]|uniref:Uncharacterized protein n=1 Tax=Oculimacula yallundae TaxID=86028 RepID=A0ABR4C618_9HELO